MRVCAVIICAATAVGVCACGSSGGPAASVSGPPNPVILSALMTDSSISVSPGRIGAGPALVTVTNQGRRAEALLITSHGRSHPLARTAPINPQGATQIKLNLGRGTYTVSLAGPAARTDAQRSHSDGEPATTLRVGRRRASSDGALLTP